MPGVLHDIVVRAALHRLDGHLLAHHPGNDDKGDVNPRFLQDTECFKTIKPLEVVIAQDDIPLPRLKGGVHRRGALHALVEGLVAALFQLAKQQQGIVFRILDNQYTQGISHRLELSSFSPSPYCSVDKGKAWICQGKTASPLLAGVG